MFLAPPRIFHALVVRITERRENSTKLGLPVRCWERFTMIALRSKARM